jgi:hypothetical protein
MNGLAGMLSSVEADGRENEADHDEKQGASVHTISPLLEIACFQRAVIRQKEVACPRAVVETGAECICRREIVVVDPEN